jgi:hypothetical protein
VNREGFADVEPEEAMKKPHRVVCIGDSFAAGVVPHHLHYTTVAEELFPDLEIYNAGVVNTGPREYLEVVRTSAVPLHPDLVVVTLFVGNDLTDAQRGNPSLVATLTDRNEVLIRQLVRRLAATWSERRAGGTVADPSGSTMTRGMTDGGELTPAEAEREMPWLLDPFQEIPALSEERFGYVEYVRSEILRPESSARSRRRSTTSSGSARPRVRRRSPAPDPRRIPGRGRAVGASPRGRGSLRRGPRPPAAHPLRLAREPEDRLHRPPAETARVAVPARREAARLPRARHALQRAREQDRGGGAGGAR